MSEGKRFLVCDVSSRLVRKHGPCVSSKGSILTHGSETPMARLSKNNACLKVYSARVSTEAKRPHNGKGRKGGPGWTTIEQMEKGDNLDSIETMRTTMR